MPVGEAFLSNSTDPGQNLAATGSAAAFATSVPTQIGVMVCSLAANTDKVYIGCAAGVTAVKGIELSPGDREFFPVNNVNKLYVVAASGTQNVHAVAL